MVEKFVFLGGTARKTGEWRGVDGVNDFRLPSPAPVFTLIPQQRNRLALDMSRSLSYSEIVMVHKLFHPFRRAICVGAILAGVGRGPSLIVALAEDAESGGGDQKSEVVVAPEIPPAGNAASETLPKWTSQAGDSIEAEVVELTDDGRVVLRTLDGALLQIPREALIPRDQARLRTIEQRWERQRLQERRRSVEQCRAVIPEVYVHPNETVLGRRETPIFDAVVLATTRMDVFVKENGRYLSPPIRVSFSVNYYDSEARQHRQRRVLEYVQTPAWADHVAHYRMNLEDDVYAEVRFVVGENRLELGYQLRDPRRITYASSPRITLGFPAIYFDDAESDPPLIYTPRMPEGVQRASFLNSISSYELKWATLDARRGDIVRHFYHRSLSQMGYNVAWFEIGGGVFGPTTVRIERPRRGGILAGYIYHDNLPAQGYSINFMKENHTTPADRDGEQLIVLFR